jgi:hypothetical protein
VRVSVVIHAAEGAGYAESAMATSVFCAESAIEAPVIHADSAIQSYIRQILNSYRREHSRLCVSPAQPGRTLSWANMANRTLAETLARLSMQTMQTPARIGLFVCRSPGAYWPAALPTGALFILGGKETFRFCRLDMPVL